MRIPKLQNKLNTDLALIFSIKEPNPNMAYFAGYHGIGVLAVMKNKSFLLVPEMEYEKAKLTKLKVYQTEKKRMLIDNLTLLLQREKISKTGIEEHDVSVALYKKLRKGLKGRFSDITETMSEIRMVKEKEELKNIETACSIADNIYSKICNNFKFRTEEELKEFILEETRKNKCEPSFPPIVASGKGTSQPHYDASNKIGKGFLMLDFGVKYKGYCSDMTRMLYMGKPSKQELEDFNLILSVVEDCQKASEKKKKFSELYNLSLELLGDKAKYFTHGLGHGLGIEIHEAPSLREEDNFSIEDNIPFTIEPGIYYPEKYGIRVEDTVVLIKGKLRILTKSKKDLVII
jgi:Xaa-Pro aminopeptidase